MERYRKQRIQRQEDVKAEDKQKIRIGLVWHDPEGESHYAVLPGVLGLDGVWREIPREVRGDFPTPGEQTAVSPEPDSSRPPS